MDLDTNTAAALLSALGLAREYGGAAEALAATGVDLPEPGRLDGLSADLSRLVSRPATDGRVREALALGFLAGRVAHRPRRRTWHDPTSFVMDQDLVVRAADGESVLRMPWFEDELFVGRQLPDIHEMPGPVRKLCVESYSAALTGERGRFEFTSYGHSYSVDAVPLRRDDHRVDGVLAIAVPGRSVSSAATAYERTAERLERVAAAADQQAERLRLAGEGDAEAAARHRAQKARRAVELARANARRLFSRVTAGAVAEPSVTPREVEVLSLASHGLTYAEIAEQLAVTTATVKTHLENIYAKLGVSDKAAAVATALRHGLID
jgi:DNA-binding NarL/FixJ family response regulator